MILNHPAPPPCLPVCLLPVEDFSQESRNAEIKKDSQKDQIIIMQSLSTVKDILGASRTLDNILSHILRGCLTDIKTAGGEGNSMMTGLYPGHELLQISRINRKQMGTNGPWTEDQLYLKQVKADSGQTGDQFEDDCQGTLWCFCMWPALSVISAHLLLVRGWGTRPLDRCLPSTCSFQHLK